MSKPFNRGRNTNAWNARTTNDYPRLSAVSGCKCPLCAWIIGVATAQAKRNPTVGVK